MKLTLILSFLLFYVLLTYLDVILLGEVKRYENFLLAAILAGVVYGFRLLTKPKP